MEFGLSQSIDSAALRASFDAQGYVHIPSVLPDDVARRIHLALASETPWNLVFHDGEHHVDMSADQLAQLDQQQLGRLQQSIFARARRGFQYSYHSYPIFDAVQQGLNEGHLLHELFAWLNSDEFVQFSRAATGFDDITFVDAQATRYSPGQFLTTHDDIQEGKNRRAAYIFNFTPEWRPDWGGYLQLLDESDNVRIGLAPTFNALNIIAIPQRHNVSFVTPFAGDPRFAVSGWLRFGAA